jgi:hypothetical protein
MCFLAVTVLELVQVQMRHASSPVRSEAQQARIGAGDQPKEREMAHLLKKKGKSAEMAVDQ